MSELPPVAKAIPATSPAAVEMSEERLSEISPLLDRMTRDDQYAGISVAIARYGKVVYRHVAGFQDVAKQIPLTEDSIFRIYSMTKPITSVAVMMLVEQGKIDLDAAVENYLPELASRVVSVGQASSAIAARRSITTRDLLRHTSGLTYGPYGKTAVDQQYLQNQVLAPEQPLSAMVNKIGLLPLVCHPGERFTYSVSTDVLARLIEVVSGEPFDRFLWEHIFVPLGMNDTGHSIAKEKVSRLTCNYFISETNEMRVFDQAERSKFLKKPALLLGGSGLVSTMDDYLRFCLMLANRGELGGQRLLRPETVAAMTSNQLVGSAYPIDVNGDVRHGVGFGLGVSVVCETLPYQRFVPIGEFGWGGAASTHFWISPRHDLVVIVMSQRMPYTRQLENVIKPMVYSAILR